MSLQITNRSQASDMGTSKAKTVFTTLEAEQLRMSYVSEPPKPQRCNWCGAPLYYEGIGLYGRIFVWNNMPRRCTCRKAIEYWEKYDARMAAEKAKKEAEERERLRLEALQRRIKRSRMSRKYTSCNFESFAVNNANRKAKETAVSYVENFEEHSKNGVGLYLAGSCGTGKTHLSSAVALALMEKEHYVIAQSSVDILATIKDSYDRKCPEEELAPYMECDVLIIDDLGKEACTPWSISMIYRIINRRYCDMKPTIITTNYDEEQLISRLTPSGDDDTAARAIMSRLHESSIGISMYWQDMREK